MNPIDFPKANFTFLAPSQMPECSDMRVYRDGVHIISCWQLTPEERRMIALTGLIWLIVVGATTPPVALSIEDPVPGPEVPIPIKDVDPAGPTPERPIPYVVDWKRFRDEMPETSRAIWLSNKEVGVHWLPVWSNEADDRFWTHWAYATFNVPAGPGGVQ